MVKLMTKNISKILKHNEPAVVVPLSVWEDLNKNAERYLEDQEMLSSRKYVSDIASSRKSKQRVSLTVFLKKYKFNHEMIFNSTKTINPNVAILSKYFFII